MWESAPAASWKVLCLRALFYEIVGLLRDSQWQRRLLQNLKARLEPLTESDMVALAECDIFE